MDRKATALALTLFLILIIPLTAIAEKPYLDLSPGEMEIMHFNLVTFLPGYSKSDNELKIEIVEGPPPVLLISQAIDMKEQNTRIVTVEKYHAETLEFITSRTLLQFPPEAAERIGASELEITARREGDELVINSNFEQIPSARLAFDEDLVTGIGSMVLARDRRFELHKTWKYRQINLINIAGEPFTPVEVTDSVVSVDEFVSTPLGEYECVKVMKILPDMVAFTYYSKENAIPVLVEGFDRETSENSMNITINGYYRK